MANNRPINRRPWRKKPWSKKVRPTRWNASTTTVDPETAAAQGYQIPVALQPHPPLVTLVSGQIDVEPWADDQEVTLDRTVGTINITGTGFWDSGEVTALPWPIIKFGLLVNEEISQETGALPQVNLFDQECLEDYEWMWLATVMPEFISTRLISGDQFVTNFMLHLELDIRNRRKIGQSDELNLYGSFANDFVTPGSLPGILAFVDIRTILMSR